MLTHCFAFAFAFLVACFAGGMAFKVTQLDLLAPPAAYLILVSLGAWVPAQLLFAMSLAFGGWLVRVTIDHRLWWLTLAAAAGYGWFFIPTCHRMPEVMGGDWAMASLIVVGYFFGIPTAWAVMLAGALRLLPTLPVQDAVPPPPPPPGRF
ncbi:MAG: hypothetical protein ACOCZK_05425 [Planctomycetota bacterium]